MIAATDELFGSASTFFCETGRGRLQIGGKTGADRCGDGILGCSSMGSNLIRSSRILLGLKSGSNPGILSEFNTSVFCTIAHFLLTFTYSVISVANLYISSSMNP